MSTVLKVAHVVLSLDVGGLERNVVNQVREGHKLGERVDVVCLERPGTLAPQAEALGATVVCLNKRSGLRFELIGQMKAVLRELHPDVVHTHQIGALLYTGPAARRFGVPLVVHTEHGKEEYARRLRTRLLGRLGGHYAARFYCLSEEMAANVIAYRIVPQRKVHVIGNGIDTARFHGRGEREPTRRLLGIPPDAQVIGSVGRLTEIKRFDLLIRAFAQLRARVPSCHLLLVGDGPLMLDLRSLAASLVPGDCVHFVGYQAEPERYYQAMDVLALTSRSEGIPQAVLEASAGAIPVIASRVGGVPEIIEHGRTGLLFPAHDEIALVDGLHALLTDPGLARTLSTAARSHVESRFTIGRMAAEYHRHFLELLGAGYQYHKAAG